MTAKVACEHFWKLAPPREAESEGVCKLCGDRQMFSNREQSLKVPSWRHVAKARKQEG